MSMLIFPVFAKLYTRARDGSEVYLGKCRLRRSQGGFFVTIKRGEYELSATGQFTLHLPKRFAYRHRGRALLVAIGGKNKVMTLDLVVAIEGKIW